MKYFKAFGVLEYKNKCMIIIDIRGYINVL